MPIGNGGSILIVLYSILFVAASPFEAGFKGGVSREIFVCFFPKFIFISFHFDLIKFLSAHHLGVNIDAKKGCEVCATYLGTIGAIKTTRDAYQQQQHSIPTPTPQGASSSNDHHQVFFGNDMPPSQFLFFFRLFLN